MVVNPKQNKGDKEAPPQSKTPLIVSVVFHVAVLLVVIFGLPHWKSEVDIVDPVPVELVANVGELTTTNMPPVESPKKPDKEEPPKKQEEKKPEVKKSAAPPPPEENDLKDPPKPDEVTEKIPDKKKPPPKKEEKKPEKKNPKKVPPAEDKKNDSDSFDSLLKNLTPEDERTPDTEGADKTKTNPTPSPNVSRFSSVLSISELDALRQQLSQCWSVMAGAQDSQDLRVEISVVVNPDRTVSSAKIVDQFRYGSDTFFRAAADSAKRALSNPLCTPLNLPPEKYDQWHEMTIVFDPKEMF